MTKQQIIEIAKAGFPEHVWKIVGYRDEELEYIRLGDVWRLYVSGTPFCGYLPTNSLLNIEFRLDGSEPYVQFTNDRHGYAFNHLAAIRKMEELGIINKNV